MRICTKSAQCTKLDGHGGLHGTWNAELGEYVPLESGAAENARPVSTHRNLADHFASVPRYVGGPTPTPTPADAARRVVRAEYLREKAERIAAEQIDAYADDYADDPAAFRRNAEEWRALIEAAALAALTEMENTK